MQIIAHRGLWENKTQQNTINAFQKAFENGFGVETDFRWHEGELIISHDFPAKVTLPAKDVFKLYDNKGHKNCLAINIKMDGLQQPIYQELKKYNIKNYFIFDASVPDLLIFIKKKMNVYTRQSEYEGKTPLLKKSIGIWLDSFERDWYTKITLQEFLRAGLKICVVSPELHQRQYIKVWELLKPFVESSYSRQLSVCTDFPFKAKKYFE